MQHRIYIPQLKFLFLILLFVGQLTLAQNTNIIGDSSISVALAGYNASFTSESHLFSGREEKTYNFKLTGYPYFDNQGWQRGAVDYDGSIYTKVFLMFNSISQELVVLNFDGVQKIQLNKEKVKGFTIGGHNFIRSVSKNSDEEDQYYEVLSSGKVKFWVLRKKKINETMTSTQVEREVEKQDFYFLVRDGFFNKVSNKKSVYRVFQNTQFDIPKFLRENKIRFKSNRELAITKITDYYNSTQK